MAGNQKRNAAEKEFVFESRLPSFAIPDVDMTLPEFVFDGVEDYADQVAIVDSSDGRKYTYGEFTRLIKNTASGLASVGVKKGDVVCIVLPNVAEYYILVFGILTVGGIFSGCNPYAHSSEIQKQIRSSEAKLIITDPATLAKMTDMNVPIVVAGGEAPSGTVAVETLFRADGSKAPSVSISPDDVCLLPYSSGTTGMPKGVMLTHRNMVANLCQTMGRRQTRFSDDQLISQTVLGLMPFFHIYGICGLGCVGFRSRGTVVVMQRYEIRRLLQVLIDYGVTHAPLVPPIILSLVKNPIVDEFDLKALKLTSIMCASAPLGFGLQQAFQKKFPDIEITQAYGLTEYSCVTMSHSPLVNGMDIKPAKQGSVGCILTGSKLKFVDPDTGRSLPANTHGELCIKGPATMSGYFKNAAATENIIDQDGWLHTGDIGYIDEDGDVFIVERLKELIKIPDDEAGEIPAACVVLKPNSPVKLNEVKEYVNSQISSYKKIRFIESVLEIPKSMSGKILRRTLRDQVALKYRGQTRSLL
ncbi:hypothetical protein R1flu_020860 [Riccia fluitans]|uniref:4-coumarate--CoA ligase n=1 Tax=Riccia fluitans TaxID=41844 RepID=A0ABD1ZNW7_9MARC